ncbi:MAG: hypothetical protein GY838_07830 [bacterium]|nr:hypothetical protein [bacterium]
MLAGLLPLVVAFNGAVAGFTLVKRPDRLARLLDATTRGFAAWWPPAALGGLCALLSLGVLSLLGLEALSREFFGVVLLVLACLGSLICGAGGAWIAVKQAELAQAKS